MKLLMCPEQEKCSLATLRAKGLSIAHHKYAQDLRDLRVQLDRQVSRDQREPQEPKDFRELQQIQDPRDTQELQVPPEQPILDPQVPQATPDRLALRDRLDPQDLVVLMQKC